MLTCHCTVGAGFPVAAAVKVTAPPMATDWFCGFTLTTGEVGVVAVTTLSVNVRRVVAPHSSAKLTVMVYIPTGPALVIVTAPVVVLPLNVPVKPAEATAVTLAIGPLSAGATFGMTVAPLPVETVVSA